MIIEASIFILSLAGSLDIFFTYVKRLDKKRMMVIRSTAMVVLAPILMNLIVELGDMQELNGDNKIPFLAAFTLMALVVAIRVRKEVGKKDY